MPSSCRSERPTDWFAAGDPAAERAAGGPLRVVFFGSFTPLHGTVDRGAGAPGLAEGALADHPARDRPGPR